ncbi:unnamed protein product [Enterobius vermicularis]|uniref:Uncharacterized protein n=1 Tax=Enterobius vermicularis TaxID=51028 RepID=A0A3P6H7Z4_ENTVE|nr:unnamed protein product [Enterobius vermicularis]
MVIITLLPRNFLNFVEAGRRTSHVVPSSVLERVRSFVSKVAVTNECLSASSSDEGFHIEVVETDDDSTAGSDLSHEEDEEDKLYVEIDLSVVKDEDYSKDAQLPEAFRRKKPSVFKKRVAKRKFIEEVEEDDSKKISS